MERLKKITPTSADSMERELSLLNDIKLMELKIKRLTDLIANERDELKKLIDIENRERSIASCRVYGSAGAGLCGVLAAQKHTTHKWKG